MEKTQQPKKRLKSLDALRGFDMFWIIGGKAAFLALLPLLGFGKETVAFFNTQLSHCGWEGFRFYDLIFPLFVFMSGITIPYSILSRKAKGDSVKSLQLKIIKRFFILTFIGLSFTLFKFIPSEIKIYNVLFLIGGSYLVGATVCLHREKTVSLIAWALGILLVYHCTLLYWPVPGQPANKLLPGKTMAGFIDQNLLQFKLHMGVFSPEGFIRIFTGGVLVILGCLTGKWIKQYDHPCWKCARELAIGGLAILLISWIWSFSFPIIKPLWSPSYILMGCGWSLLLLSAFYIMVDILEWKPISYFFCPIGMNAITIYAGAHYINFVHTSNYFFMGFAKWLSGLWQPFILAFGLLALEWALLKYLDQKKIYLKV